MIGKDGACMELFDMHCDTLYRAYTEKSTLFDDSFHISFDKTEGISPYIQCLAVWIPDEYRGEDAWRLFCGCVDKLYEQLEGTDIVFCKTAEDICRVRENGGRGIILTVEGGAVLGGDIKKVQTLYDMGVRIMTLTWNGANELGDGIMEPEDRGLTGFGRAVVREMERVGIIVDLSHAGEKLFHDTAEIAERPFVATHSNIRSVTDHRRNLTDQQFCVLVKNNSITGLNFCRDFLDCTPCEKEFTAKEILHSGGMCAIISHAKYMCSLGGEKNIAMGADFDGADIPADIDGISSMPDLYEMFSRHFPEQTVRDIFFENAFRFFEKNLTAEE